MATLHSTSTRFSARTRELAEASLEGLESLENGEISLADAIHLLKKQSKAALLACKIYEIHLRGHAE